jgi:RNase P subunit RPR2
MRIFECENCHSVFIVNETDDRVMQGQYGVLEKIDCPQCCAEMFLLAQKIEEEKEE